MWKSEQCSLCGRAKDLTKGHWAKDRVFLVPFQEYLQYNHDKDFLKVSVFAVYCKHKNREEYGKKVLMTNYFEKHYSTEDKLFDTLIPSLKPDPNSSVRWGSDLSIYLVTYSDPSIHPSISINKFII